MWNQHILQDNKQRCWKSENFQFGQLTEFDLVAIVGGVGGSDDVHVVVAAAAAAAAVAAANDNDNAIGG